MIESTQHDLLFIKFVMWVWSTQHDLFIKLVKRVVLHRVTRLFKWVVSNYRHRLWTLDNAKSWTPLGLRNG
jgi:hypothetical protein